MVRQSREHVCEPGARIDAVDPARQLRLCAWSPLAGSCSSARMHCPSPRLGAGRPGASFCPVPSPADIRGGAIAVTAVRSKRLRLEKPRIECEWRNRRNRYPSATRVPVIDQNIAVGRAGDWHDDRRDHENEFGAFIEPCIPERLRVSFVQSPIARQGVKRYAAHRNIIWNDVLHHGLGR